MTRRCCCRGGSGGPNNAGGLNFHAGLGYLTSCRLDDCRDYVGAIVTIRLVGFARIGRWRDHLNAAFPCWVGLRLRAGWPR